jgi:hypothetical protein
VELTAPSRPDVRVARATDKQVTFVWDREKKGDLYKYQVIDLNGSLITGWTDTATPRAVVKALADGNTCLQVVVRRESQSSPFGKTCKVAQP